MKKLLLTFLPLLLAVLGVNAQDFSTTVTWSVPGSIEVIRGGNPTLGTAVKQTLTADQTSFTVTDISEPYWFKAADGYTLDSATMDGASVTLTNLYGINYYKLDPTYGNYKNLNGKTIVLTTGVIEYDGSFVLDINNGSGLISIEMKDANQNTTRYLTPEDGKKTIPLIKGETTMIVKTSDYSALYQVKVGNTEIAYTAFKYTVPITNGCEVYIAATEPATTNCKVSFKFVNNNPDCIWTVRNWTTNKFVENFAAGFEVPAGTVIQINKKTSDYTYNSITANGVAAQFNKRITINEDTEFVIDATSLTYADLEATVYTNNIAGVEFTNSQLETSAKDIVVTKVADKAAGTVTFPAINYTISEPTTEYKLTQISGKTGRVFFEIQDGYWLKNGVLGNAEDKQEYYIAGTTSFLNTEAPVLLNIGKINFDTPVHIIYEGPANNARLRAKYADGTAVENATYGGANPNEYVTPGKSEIMIDPEYDSYFEISMAAEGEYADYQRMAVLDGTVLTYNSDDSEASGVFSNVVLKENSLLKIFFAPELPKSHKLMFLTAGDAKATLAYDGISTTDFTKDITNYGTVEYVLTPEAGTKVIVNGAEATLTAGKYTFTPAAESTTKIQLVKEGYGAIADSTNPATGATEKSMSSFEVIIAMDEAFATGESSLNIVEDPAAWVSASFGGKAVGVKSFEMGDPTETGIPFTVTLADTLTTAGTFTATIPAGIIYETFPNADWSEFNRTASSRVNQELTLTVTIDPNMVYTWSFDPAADSQNDLPEDDTVIITLSLPQAKTLSEEAFAEAAGPWLTYNGTPVAKVEDPYEETGWAFTQTMATWNKPALAIEISKNVFTKAGQLTIKADEGAFTVNGIEGSPAIDYTATFGTVKEYTYTIAPENGTEISEWEEFTLTFPEATTVAYDEENGYVMFMQGGTWAAIDVDVTVTGNMVVLNPVSEMGPTSGTLSLVIDEGSFILDGESLSPEITASWTYKRSTPVNFEWTADPSGNIINDGSGIYAAIIWDEMETVSVKDESAIVVKFNGETLGETSYEDEDTKGVVIESYGDNMLLINAIGGDLYDPATEGPLSVSIPAGALLISGEPNPAAIEYTWNVVAKKEYDVVITPADGSTVKEITEVTVEFTNAETVAISEYFQNGWVGVWTGYSMTGSALSLTAVEGAEHPTFKATVAPITEAGSYRITFAEGTFYLDNAQQSEMIEANYTVDPNLSGIEGVGAENGLYTVYNLQGILVLRDADADALKALPAGVYVVNGKKVALD